MQWMLVFSLKTNQSRLLNEVGDVGYITASIKTIQDTRVGDTVALANNPAMNRQMDIVNESMVYCGLYPIDSSKYNDLRDALEKLQLNDAALQFEAETSQALGWFPLWFLRITSYGRYSRTFRAVIRLRFDYNSSVCNLSC